MQAATSQTPENKFPNETPVIYIEPLGRRDERAVVTKAGPISGNEKEVRMKPCELTCCQSVPFRDSYKPLLPTVLD
jgi:hypothetical protein